ncbi:TIGR00266 family protein [bacterium]|nr:TIGR00266 family protein [bacterium]
MSQWYLSYDGNQIGPFDQSQAVAKAQENSNGYAWRNGFAEWMPISQVGELNPSAMTGMAPPPVSTRVADEIDFKIIGSEMQFVEVELDPGESAVAEAGAMMYKDSCIEMNTIFGDCSSQQNQGFMGKLLGAGKRLLTGESLFITVFTHTGQGKAHVSFAAPYPGNIIPVTLANMGGCLICQKDAFVCAAKGVSIGIAFQRKILTGLFGGEGFIMQKLEGDGMCFLHAGGTVVERQLGPGEVLHVDTGCVVAYEPQIDFDIQQAGNIKSMLFGGEGIFFATLRGPGKIWLQSLPFSRLAGRMLAAVPGNRKGGTGEGSVLGGLGNLLDGDGL